MVVQTLKFRFLRSLLVFVLGTFSLVSCGGGGSGTSSSTGGTGSVSVLVTDLPTDQYCEINVTVTKAVLIGDDGQVTLYSDPAGKTFNLLELAHHSEVFSHTTGVPAGTYSKIRLVLDGDVQLKPDASCEDPSTWIDARVPSGKLDLNPQGDFTVPASGALVVELDMAAKAFKLTHTGNGKYLVRPVVFVNVLSDNSMGKLVRVYGTVQNKMEDTQGGSFDLCRTDIAWHDKKSDSTTEHCVTVQVGGESSVFNALGDPASFADVTNGGNATVIGRLDVTKMETQGVSDTNGHSQDNVVFNAEVIELGDKGVYGRYTGIVRSLPADAEDAFDFEFYPPQGILSKTVVPVDLQSGTKLYSRLGEAIAPADFSLGLDALTEGVLVIGTDDFIKSSVVWVDLQADQMSYEGSVSPSTVDVTARTFTLMPAGTGTVAMDRTVKLTDDAVILLVSESGGVLSNDRISLDDMAALSGNHEAQVYGTEQTDGSILSDRVILQAPEPAPSL
jgi:hypothetical protein